MTDVYFIGLVLLVTAMLGYALWKPARMFEYPAIMGFALATFILPQAISLMRFPGGVQDESVEAVLLMSCLCAAAALFGYLLRPCLTIVKWTARPLDMKKLFHVGVVFAVVGYLFGRAFGTIDVQFAEGGGMTGRGTILLFFQQLCLPGFAICLFCALRRPTIVNVLASLVAVVPLVEAMVIGRREGTAQLALIILLAFYFERKWVPPRWLFAAGLVGSMLVIPSTVTYRELAEDKGAAAIWDIDFVGDFEKFMFEETRILELRNGAATIEATRWTGRYDYGAGYWNHLVFRFVPAQLLGKEFKEYLHIGTLLNVEDSRITEKGFEISIGSTLTGMGDAFLQFGWFGSLFFAFMAVVFKSLWEAAQRPDAMFAKLLYVLSCTSAMRAVTHWTLDFLPGMLYFVIFLSIAMIYARRPEVKAR